jgi:hypothetical protein
MFKRLEEIEFYVRDSEKIVLSKSVPGKILRCNFGIIEVARIKALQKNTMLVCEKPFDKALARMLNSSKLPLKTERDSMSGNNS